MGTRPAAGEELMGHSAAGAAVSETAAASRCWYESAFEIGARRRKPAKHAPTSVRKKIDQPKRLTISESG